MDLASLDPNRMRKGNCYYKRGAWMLDGKKTTNNH
jgi:hypothetical protein